MKVGIFSTSKDVHAITIKKCLEERGFEVDIIDVSTIISAPLFLKIDTSTMTCSIDLIEGTVLPLNEYDAFLGRRFFLPPINEQDSILNTYRLKEFKGLISSLAFFLEDKMFPSYTPMLLAENKALQLKMARSAGLTLPTTVLGNSIKGISKNLDATFAVKPLRYPAINMQRGQYRGHIGAHTKLVTQKSLYENVVRLQNTPITAQNYIEKKYELRITVVGKKLFAAGIDTQSDDGAKIDSRAGNYENMKYWKEALPKEVKNKILEFMKLMGMNFACIDMIVTPNGDYVFLESNPNGQWLWIEKITGMPISHAITEELVKIARKSLSK